MLGQPSDLDLRLIRVFLAVVDAGGITPAQATLNVGQSTISTQLSTLETRLGYRLCERGRSGFRLTARGGQFVDSARKLLAALDTFSAEARKVGRTLVGTLNLGLIGHAPVNANARISQAIERFRQRDESVHFTVSVSPAERLVTALADNMEAVAMLVLSGRHLGYLPEHFAAPYVAQGLLAPLAPEAMRYDVPFDMVVRRDARRNELLAAFVADMKAAHA